MSSAPSIRKFDHQEWPIYRDLRLRALGDAPDAFGSTLDQEEGRPGSEWARRLLEGSDPWNLPLLAEVDSEPAGLAWAGSSHPALSGRIFIRCESSLASVAMA